MIDIEQDVFLAVRTAVLAAYPNATVSTIEEREPAKFPFVAIGEMSNATKTDTIDSSLTEKFVTVMYQVDCYSNKANGRKAECKALLSVVDGVMTHLGFYRTMSNPVNMDRATAYRMTARYTASVDANKTIYRR